MDSEPLTSKDSLRTELRARLRTMPADRSALDGSIMHRLDCLLEGFGEYCVAGYSAMAREPDLWPLLKRVLSTGHRLYLPRYASASGTYEMVEVQEPECEMRLGRYGILEPESSLPGGVPPFVTSTPWVWLVPALGYDASGHRLGHGGGYYDRLLGGANGVRVGVAYDCQLVDALPFEAHDVVMDYVVTESQLRNCE